MQTQNLPETNPHHPTNTVKQMLSDIVTHLHEDTTQVDEPKAQALFETTAEVLSVVCSGNKPLRTTLRTGLEIDCCKFAGSEGFIF